MSPMDYLRKYIMLAHMDRSPLFPAIYDFVECAR
jgi:hypothetical protein